MVYGFELLVRVSCVQSVFVVVSFLSCVSLPFLPGPPSMSVCIHHLYISMTIYSLSFSFFLFYCNKTSNLSGCTTFCGKHVDRFSTFFLFQCYGISQLSTIHVVVVLIQVVTEMGKS